jgi:hypothetical protein
MDGVCLNPEIPTVSLPAVTRHGFVAPLENVPPSQAGAVPAPAEGSKLPLHAGNPIGLRCFAQEVKWFPMSTQA